MRILITQMTRMGDMLQTSPLIRALRRRHPDAAITVMVRPMGKGTAERNPDIDEIFLYDEDSLFLDLRSHDSDRLLNAYKSAGTLAEWIRESRFDVAYNCTHSIASAMLLKIAGVPNVIGAHATDDWRFILRGKWANYFFASVLHRDYNDLNLCDITGRFPEDAPPCRELVFHVSNDDREHADTLLAGHSAGDAPLVALQLGASDEDKRWAVSHFAELAQSIVHKYDARILLLGTGDEAPLGDTFERHAPGLALPLYGKTSIAQAAAVLERSQLLVTNDTGTMHVAAAVGCPVVLVSVGYVHFRETGPYGPGHLAVERRKSSLETGEAHLDPEDERSAIGPHHVMAAVALGLEKDNAAPGLDDSEELAGVEIHRADFAPDGCLEWYPVIRRPIAERDFLRLAYRLMWLDHLDSLDGAEAEEASIAKLLACYIGEEEGRMEDWRRAAEENVAELARLAETGIGITKDLLAALEAKTNQQKAEELVGHLMALDEEVRILGELHRPLRPLVSIQRFERDNLESAAAAPLAETTLRIYEDCLARASLLCEKFTSIHRAWTRESP